MNFVDLINQAIKYQDGEYYVVDDDDNWHHIEFINSKPDDDDVPFSDVECCDHDCEGCCACDELVDYDIQIEVEEDDEDEDLCDVAWGIPLVRSVIFNDPATIVFWEDDTKTVVKCMKGEKFERYAGFMAACMKKMFGSTSAAKSLMKSVAVDQPKPLPKKKPAVPVPDLTQALNEVIANHESAQEAINEALTR